MVLYRQFNIAEIYLIFQLTICLHSDSILHGLPPHPSLHPLPTSVLQPCRYLNAVTLSKWSPFTPRINTSIIMAKSTLGLKRIPGIGLIPLRVHWLILHLILPGILLLHFTCPVISLHTYLALPPPSCITCFL